MGLVWVVAAVMGVALDLIRLRVVAFRRRADLAAEAVLLRKQLAILRSLPVAS